MGFLWNSKACLFSWSLEKQQHFTQKQGKAFVNWYLENSKWNQEATITPLRESNSKLDKCLDTFEKVTGTCKTARKTALESIFSDPSACKSKGKLTERTLEDPLLAFLLTIYLPSASQSSPCLLSLLPLLFFLNLLFSLLLTPLLHLIWLTLFLSLIALFKILTAEKEKYQIAYAPWEKYKLLALVKGFPNSKHNSL